MMPCRRYPFLAPLLALRLLGAPSFARADDTIQPPDTVFLRNGGKLRGMVVEEDPKQGVTIQLLDGTSRKISKAALDHVEYAAPPIAPPPPGAVVPPPMVYAPPPTGFPAPEPTRRRSKGLMITGFVVMPLGALALGAGIPYYVSASQTNNTGPIGTGCDSNGVCGSTSESYHDSTGQTIATGMMVGGGVFLVAGLVFTLVGGAKIAANEQSSLDAWPPQLALGSGFTANVDNRGLTLHF